MDERQTLVLGASGERLAEVIYWGERLSDHEDLEALYHANQLECDRRHA